MEINIDRIKSRFDNKVRKEDIVKIYNEFKRINSVLKFNLGLEETIVKYFKCVLNNNKIQSEINQRVMEMEGNRNELKLLRRNEFDLLRMKGKLMDLLYTLDKETLTSLLHMGCVLSEEVSEINLFRFRKERDENNRNYNVLNLDGNVSVSSNVNSWK